MNGVPYFYEKVYRRFTEAGLADKPGELMKLFGGRMRLCVSGVRPITSARGSVLRIPRACACLQGYGLTEVVARDRYRKRKARKLGTVGRPVPGVEVRISDEGEILTRGPHVMLGYWQDPKSTADTISTGWLQPATWGNSIAKGFCRSPAGRKS